MYIVIKKELNIKKQNRLLIKSYIGFETQNIIHQH